MKIRLLALAGCIVLLGACKQGLTPEEQAQIKVLQADLQEVRSEIANASNVEAGGLLKAYSDLRVEILKTTEALVYQRIQAIESGAKVTVAVSGTTPDLVRAAELESEINSQEEKVAVANQKANGVGGLVAAMARVAAITEENSLSLLRQQYLVAKYGLAMPQFGALSADTSSSSVTTSSSSGKNASPADDESLQSQILEVKIVRKRYEDRDYQDVVLLDVDFDPVGLDKPARSIKGVLVLTDLFGESKFKLKWTLEEPIQPGKVVNERGSGFEYNQFQDEHQWVRTTSLDNMKAKFMVTAILYEDGSTREF